MKIYTPAVQPNSVNKSLLRKVLFIVFFVSLSGFTYAQVGAPPDSLKIDSLRKKNVQLQNRSYNINKEYDFNDLTRNIFHPSRKADTLKHRNGITVVPNVAANPTIGAQLGIKAVAGRRLGNDPNTFLSVAATSASYTSKGILFIYLNHNIFTPGNAYNFQGNIVASKTVSPDYGFGIGRDLNGQTLADKILEDPTHKVYPIHSYYFNIREKVYKKIDKNLFVGAGLSFDVRRSITNKDTVNNQTPSSVYNNQHGFPQNHYAADGFLFDVEYITRDNPNRAYKGIYFDAGIRVNQTWIGSTKNSFQVTTDLRKYISLSQSSPETVLALWNWGSYLVSGAIPYLELPGTARDGAFRSGRGYTTQYFKGTEFNDTEAEFRFPILANKFVSGVVFGSMQTGNDEQGTKIFQVFEPGYGAGLRLLFNKATRTNLALDYAFGRFGNKGFFLNLNEAF